MDAALLPKFVGFTCFTGIYLLLAIWTIWQQKIRLHASLLLTPFLVLYIGYWVFAGISLFQTNTLADGLYEWVKIGLLPAFLLGFALIFQKTPSRWFSTTLAKLLAFSALFSIGIGLFEFMSLANTQAVTHESSYFIRGTFAHKNLFSEILFLHLPLILYGGLYLKGMWRSICQLATIAIVFMIVIFLSRAVWLALLGGAIIVGGIRLMYIQREKGISAFARNLTRRQWFGLGTFLLAVVGGIIFYAQFDSLETLQKHIMASVNLQHGSAFERIDMWSKTLLMIKEHFLLGIGLGDWRIEILPYQLLGQEASYGLTFYQRPHNDFLWVFAENGILGILFYVLCFGSGLYMGGRLIHSAKAEYMKHIGYITVFGLVGYIIIASLAFPRERMEHFSLLAILMAVTSVCYAREFRIKQASQRVHLIAFILTFLLTISALWIGSQRLKGDYHAQQIRRYRIGNHWQHILNESQKLPQAYYPINPVSTPIKFYEGEALFNLQKRPEAHAAFLEAMHYNPYHAHLLNNLGTSHGLMGKLDTAAAYYIKSVIIAPNFEESHLNLAVIRISQKRYKEAYQNLRFISKDNQDPRYQKYLLQSLKYLIEDYANNVKDITLNKGILRIAADPKWALDVHYKSIENRTPFPKQLLLDAIYTMEILEKSITPEQGKALIEEYSMYKQSSNSRTENPFLK